MVKSDTCDRLQGTYVQAITAASSAVSNYTICNTNDPTIYRMQYTVQQAVDPVIQRSNTIRPILDSINNQAATYATLITSTKALIAATQPLNNYKTILQGQLDATAQQNKTLQEQITTDANAINQGMASIPDLSNAGPFGTATMQQGVGYGFLSIYSFFFILFSVFLYLRFKKSFSGSLLITGILLLLGGAGAGAYFIAIYGLGLQHPQSLIASLTL